MHLLEEPETFHPYTQAKPTTALLKSASLVMVWNQQGKNSRWQKREEVLPPSWKDFCASPHVSRLWKNASLTTSWEEKRQCVCFCKYCLLLLCLHIHQIQLCERINFGWCWVQMTLVLNAGVVKYGYQCCNYCRKAGLCLTCLKWGGSLSVERTSLSRGLNVRALWSGGWGRNIS